MTKSYIKIDMSQVEQYLYLYYMQKYHNTLMQKIKESKIIINYDSDYSEDFVKRRRICFEKN